MRPFRVFNDITGVRIIWKKAGLRMGPLAQVLALTLMASVLLVVLATNLYVAAVYGLVAFIGLAAFVRTVTRMDETGRIGEITALSLLRRGLRSRHYRNYDSADSADIRDR